MTAYPSELIDYLSAALDKPTEGYPPLGNTWGVIASLPWAPAPPEGSAQLQLSGKIQAQIDQALKAGSPPPELAGAWLALAPAEGEKLLADSFKSGDYRLLPALRYNETVGRRLLRGLDAVNLSASAADTCLNLLREWQRVEPEDEGWLSLLAENKEPATSLRAAGWLLKSRLQQANAPADSAGGASGSTQGSVSENPEDKTAALMRERLAAAVREKYTDFHVLESAIEGIRISGDPRLADSLVNLAAKAVDIRSAELSPAADDADKKTDKDKAAKDETPFAAMYAAYALAYLPGEQAALLRRRMLEAANQSVAWNARLGELLAGDSEPWETARKRVGITPDLLVAVEPPESVHSALLPTYEQMSGSDNPQFRGTAARQLGRYNPRLGFSDDRIDNKVVALLSTLCDDNVDAVRQVAWYSAAELRVPELGPKALGLAHSDKISPGVRLAACFAALRLCADGVSIDGGKAVEEQKKAEARQAELDAAGANAVDEGKSQDKAAKPSAPKEGGK